VGLPFSLIRKQELTILVFYRVVGIYFLSTLIISLAVSQHSPLLLQAVSLGGHTAASSPFVVMCKQTGVKVLPSIINAVVSV
jgi:amino acid transporter